MGLAKAMAVATVFVGLPLLAAGSAVRAENSEPTFFFTPAPAPPAPAKDATPPPNASQNPGAKATPPQRELQKLLGTPFRVDGVQDEHGRWTLWAAPDKEFAKPGFNCSGFVLAAARSLLGRDFTLDEARRDRLGDSGPGAELGADWDFGLDLALNLTEDFSPEIFPAPPGDGAPVITDGARRLGWGLALQSPELPELLAALPREKIYFAVISKPDRRFPSGLSYYHVGLVRPDPAGPLWFCHATAKAGTHRLDLASSNGLALLRKYFPPVKNARGERRIVFVGATPRPPAGAACGPTEFLPHPRRDPQEAR